MNIPTPGISPRILVIDDNAAIHEDFRKILGGRTPSGSPLDSVEAELFGEPAKAERVAFRIDSASQGQDGLVLVEQAQYALAK